ncbi:MAG: UDP-N-acetylmuramoyl-tripeptide--D-alanyl-D-alanine ligase [Cytophagales bacterium]|nr:UDP-N-acetylmuramoyl-tripeptide--D-alanyl-D-alanine ligase [Cytophagales bacterium]
MKTRSEARDLSKKELEYLYSRFLLSTGVSLDTRSLRAGDLFFALPGKNYDGSSFVGEAFSGGASYAIVGKTKGGYKIPKSDTRKILEVQDVLKTLQCLSAYHRKRYKRTLLAITGSQGKTTTKELIRAILRKKYIVHATHGNQNNHIGVPLSLLGIYPQVEIAVLELGLSQIGDMGPLCEWTQPTHGLITNIAPAHLEGFKSVSAIEKEKLMLYEDVCSRKGIFYLNTEESSLRNILADSRTISFPTSSDSYAIKPVYPKDSLFIGYSLGGRVGKTNLFGAHQFQNIAAAISVGLSMDVPQQDIMCAIEDYVPRENRSECIHIDDNIVILDAYNANPSSMKSAIKSLASVHGSEKKVLILGDMAELGSQTAKYHEDIGATIYRIQEEHSIWESVLLCGKNMFHAYRPLENLPWVSYFKDKAACMDHIKKKTWRNMLVLIKASRFMELEDLLIPLGLKNPGSLKNFAESR